MHYYERYHTISILYNMGTVVVIRSVTAIRAVVAIRTLYQHHDQLAYASLCLYPPVLASILLCESVDNTMVSLYK